MTGPTEPVAYPPATTGGAVGRTLAFIVGFVIILVAGLSSLGAALFAALGMAVGAYIWRRRRRRLSIAGHWVAAMCGAAVVVLAYSGLIGALVPASTWKQVQHTADSTSAHTPPPKWLDRMYPGMAERAAQQQAASPKMQAIGLAYGFGFAAIFFIAIFGTFGWLGGMLLGFAVKGYWPGATS